VWFDSHCHLHLCEEQEPLSALVERAGQASVEGMVTLGTDVETSTRSVEISDRHRVFAAAGVHPSSADRWGPAAAESIEALLQRPEVVAVGETGLDFYRQHCPPAIQQKAFRAQIALARRHGKAMVVHTRNSVSEALDAVEEEGAPERFVFHCWSGHREQLERALSLGAYISFAGNVSFASASDLRELAALVPDDRVMVETDSPYLTPVPHRGKPNEPRHVVDVGRAVAEARGQDESVLADVTRANALRFFGLAGLGGGSWDERWWESR
jgi:TatD DNase family protein